MNLADFIPAAGISMSAEPADANPNMEDTRGDMSHWVCTFKRNGKRMSVRFSMGSAHQGKAPSAEDVLDCLASDSASIENARGGDFQNAQFTSDTVVRVERTSVDGTMRHVHVWEREVSQLPDCADLVAADTFVGDFLGEE